MNSPLRRKSDSERLAIVETRQDAHDDIISEIKKDIKGILRNQWIQTGVIAFAMFLIKFPSIAKLFVDTASASGIK